MSETKLIIGMPAGSLADPARGGSLVNLLRNAGFPTQGYDQGGPTSFPLPSFIVGWDGRPQEFGAQIALGEVDIAISGDDWMRERTLEMEIEYGRPIHLRKVLSLKRGEVRIVIIRGEGGGECDAWLRGLLNSKPLITMVSEMPYLALDWFRKKCAPLGFAETHKSFSIQKFKTPPKIATGIVIYETWGKTEAKVKQGAVDFGLEITQSGSSIRNYGLEIAELVMESEAGIGAVFAAAGGWVFLNLLKQKSGVDLALHGAGLAAFMIWTVAFSVALQADALRAGAAGLGLGLGAGVAAVLGASALLGQYGMGMGAGCGAFLLLNMIVGPRVAPGTTLTLTAAVAASLVAVGAVLTGQLPWYALVALALIPLVVRLPLPKGAPWMQAVVAALYAASAAVAAWVLAWLASRGSAG